MKLTVVVNGEKREIDSGATVRDLLEAMHIGPGVIAVEVNSKVVRRAQHAEHRLSAEDKIEIVTLVGGG
ncbi:MAG TPA: sulfur carrier protein ThiS [Myxococcales bacterium]